MEVIVQTLTLSITVGGTLISNYPGVGKNSAKLERKFADHKNMHI